MRNSKKLLKSAISMILCIGIISAAVIYPYDSSQDRKLRAELQGTLDFLIIGASHAQFGFSTEVLDNELGVNSYNLSSVLMPLTGRYEMLKMELDRNPINTVVLEVSYDTLCTNYNATFNEGDHIIIVRMDSIADRIHYLCKYITVDGWLNVYARLIAHGISTWKDILKNKNGSSPNNKGYTPKSTVDVTLSENAVKNKYNRWAFEFDNIRQSNVEMLNSIVDLCHEHSARVIIAVTPVSDGYMWEHAKLDDFNTFLSAFCEANGCEYYDMNLDVTRYELYSDSISYMDETHLSGNGAEIMTSRFCKIIGSQDFDTDKSEVFYENYEKMKTDSPYNNMS